MFAIAAPVKQTAEDTIVTLASRLSATLLEDRRAAILGLKSFSFSYPATVSSNGLRGLIGCLDKDRQDVETSLGILQTLLQLFNPNENSPEASEEIALWIADEFTQRQDNITLLLDFLDNEDFYIKLYSLQLLAAILSSRTERTKELICTAALGISKLVAVLEDRREAIRNEGLSLLIYLTPNSTELQKRVAFEDAFDRIFNIIKNEGSLIHGDTVVEDCLILLANLLRLNESNQTFFKEAGFVSKVAWLLSDAVKKQNEELELADWAITQKSRNLFALLAVLRLLLVTGNASTKVSQLLFWQNGILHQALKLAFSPSTDVQVKAEAFVTCADIIRGDPKLQEEFAQLQVPSVIDELPAKGLAHQIETSQVHVIDGLLELILSVSTLRLFDSRMAACDCIKAYLENHSIIRQHFLRRAIDGYVKVEDVTPNFLTILLQNLSVPNIVDPYRIWFAAVIFFNLIFDDSKSKNLAMSVREGNSTNGEEEITCLQGLAGNLLDSIKRGLDERIVIGYLMLLCGWLFEDPDSVNDFLGEASHLQYLVQAVVERVNDSMIIQGLSAILLGILYEFSTRDSPVPRSTIHHILLSQIGRDKYIDILSNLRAHPLFRDFEVMPQKLSSAPARDLPKVFFDRIFIELIKDNFNRLLRALDREPEYEVSVITNGVQKGISRDLVDSLKSQLDEKNRLIQRYEEDVVKLEKRFDQEKADHQRTKQTAEEELKNIKLINESLQKHHDDAINKVMLEHNRIVQEHKRQLENSAMVAQNHAERTRKTTEAEVKNLHQSINTLKIELEKSKINTQGLQDAHDEYRSKYEKSSAHIQALEKKIIDLETKNSAITEKAANLENSLIEKENEKNSIQAELEDLLIVFTDLEDKITKYKVKLRDIGEVVSDTEDDDVKENMAKS